MRCEFEDLLDIASHSFFFFCFENVSFEKFGFSHVVYFVFFFTNFFEHSIALIENEKLDVGQIQNFFLCQLQNSSRCSNDDVGDISLQLVSVLLNWNSSIKHRNYFLLQKNKNWELKKQTNLLFCVVCENYL